jgi:GNAT superfamily N-acetyltransferase
MATIPELRGRGIGGALLEACLEHARSRNGSIAWCNGRVGARAFYLRHGFSVVRGPFEIEGIGPHDELRRPLREPAATIR